MSRLNRPRYLLAIIALALLLSLGGASQSFFLNFSPHLPTHIHTGADWVSASVCHRLIPHSFYTTIDLPSALQRPMPLCARCSGIYLGCLLAFFFTLFFSRERHARTPSRPLCLALVGLLASMAIDGSNSLLHLIGQPHLYEPHNVVRLLTGFGGGLAIGITLAVLFAQTMWQTTVPHSILTRWRDLALLVVSAAGLALLILRNDQTIRYVLGITSAVGVVLTIMTLYTILYMVLFRWERRATAWSQVWRPLLLGLFLAILQIVCMDLIRYYLTGDVTIEFIAIFT